MTPPPLQRLLDEASELEASIARLGVPGMAIGPGDRAELEQRVIRLCATTEALPAAEAKSMADTLARLVGAFDAAAERLRAAAPAANESARPMADPKRAAAAYGNANARRRRGF